jgi:uncharacterized RDD family membrane protein YckC
MQITDRNYAGFWTRLLAFVIDMVIVSWLVYLAYEITDMEESRLPALFVLWIYFAGTISRWGTTLGGKLFGIDVLSEEGHRLTFLRASLRLFISLLPFVIYRMLREWQYGMTPPPSPDIQMLPQLVYMLYPLSMFFTDKRQMIHDMVVKSVVVDRTKRTDSVQQSEDRVENKEAEPRVSTLNTFRKILRGVGIVVFLVFIGYLGMYTFVFYKLAKGKQAAYDASFYQHYQIDDHNDTRIRFYQKELERYSKALVEAEGMYGIFAADVKRDLALNCIEAALKENNVSSWIEEGEKFRKNARNKFAKTDAQIAKAKANEDWMGRHFYDYDLNDVNEIEEKIANIWEPEKNKKTCDVLMPAGKMYDLFVQQYILNREEALQNDKQAYNYAKPTGILSKRFYKNEIEQTKQWLKLLKQHIPEAFEKAEEAKKRAIAEVERQKEEHKRKEEKAKIEALWRDAKNRIMQSPDFFKDVNADIFNDQGETPLIVAVKHKNDYFISQVLSQAKVTVRLKDRYGKTAYDYIPPPRTRIEWMYPNKVKQALMILEVYQKIRGKAEMQSYSMEEYKLQMVIKGAPCSTFDFPKFVTCYSVKGIRRNRSELVKAILKHDHKKLNALLENGAYTEIMSEYDRKSNGYTPLFFAISVGDVYAVDALLSHGANMYAMEKNKIYNAFTWAIDGGDRNINIVKMFLKHGTDVNYQHKKSETALSVAARSCRNFKLVKLLLKNGADPELVDIYGQDALNSLKRYCRNKDAYKKIKALIARYRKQRK